MNHIKKTSRFFASNLINLEEGNIVLFKSSLVALYLAFIRIAWMEMLRTTSQQLVLTELQLYLNSRCLPLVFMQKSFSSIVEWKWQLCNKIYFEFIVTIYKVARPVRNFQVSETAKINQFLNTKNKKTRLCLL
jgi:hypothetical protein